jgi:hypothetical protein
MAHNSGSGRPGHPVERASSPPLFLLLPEHLRFRFAEREREREREVWGEGFFARRTLLISGFIAL